MLFLHGEMIQYELHFITYYPKSYFSFHQLAFGTNLECFHTESIPPTLCVRNLVNLVKWQALQNTSCTIPHWHLVEHRFSVIFQGSLKTDCCMQLHIRYQKPLKDIFKNAVWFVKTKAIHLKMVVKSFYIKI